jgi:hypothetical protein
MGNLTPIASGSVRGYDSTTLRSRAEAPKSTGEPSATKIQDTWTPSGAAPPAEPENADQVQDASSKAKDAGWEGFDMGQFKAEMNARLLEQIGEAKKALEAAGVKFYGGEGKLYDLEGVDTSEYSDEVMGVGKEWGAEATSQRIVDFAMGFKGMAGDEEFMKKIRGAIEEGFKQAQGDLGELPGPTGKLFNDTYKATMDKLDKAFEEMAAAAAGKDPAQAVKAATAKEATTSVATGFSVLA